MRVQQSNYRPKNALRRHTSFSSFAFRGYPTIGCVDCACCRAAPTPNGGCRDDDSSALCEAAQVVDQAWPRNRPPHHLQPREILLRWCSQAGGHSGGAWPMTFNSIRRAPSRRSAALWALHGALTGTFWRAFLM